MARTLLIIGLQDTSIAGCRQGFAAENYLVDSAHTSARAVGMLAMRRYDAVVIFAHTSAAVTELFATLRTLAQTQQVIVVCIDTLNADDEVALLKAGATACRPLAIDFDELLAHTRALLRRGRGYPRDHRIADLGIDPVARRASRDGRPLRLRPIEFDILLHLAEGAGKPVHKEELLLRVWPGGGSSPNLLAAHVRNLRASLDRGRRCRLLHTVRNIGYKLAARP